MDSSADGIPDVPQSPSNVHGISLLSGGEYVNIFYDQQDFTTDLKQITGRVL